VGAVRQMVPAEADGMALAGRPAGGHYLSGGIHEPSRASGERLSSLRFRRNKTSRLPIDAIRRIPVGRVIW
jgi:hypothetical protein